MIFWWIIAVDAQGVIDGHLHMAYISLKEDLAKTAETVLIDAMKKGTDQRAYEEGHSKALKPAQVAYAKKKALSK